MTKVAPYYSDSQDVHHRDDTCTEGLKIDPKELKVGTGDKPVCKVCEELAEE